MIHVDVNICIYNYYVYDTACILFGSKQNIPSAFVGSKLVELLLLLLLLREQELYNARGVVQVSPAAARAPRALAC